MKHKRELPSAEEAVAYADGYLEGLHDAKEHDVARLIIERDAALSKIAFERVLRQAAERSRDELRACAAELYEQIGTLRAERDALKAEVERGDVQRVRDLTKHIERADKAEEERDAWRERESETQEALQKIGEEFGVHGGEARTDGVRRILNKYRDALTEIAGAYTAHGYSDAMDAVQALKDTARDALK